MREVAPGIVEYGAQGSVAAAPLTVTIRQACLALQAAGLLGAVGDAIDGLPEPDRTTARISWERASEVRRDWPLLSSIATALGLTAAELDALFVTAAAID